MEDYDDLMQGLELECNGTTGWNCPGQDEESRNIFKHIFVIFLADIAK